MKNIIKLLFVCVLIQSCSSPLSDLPISDPGLITPHFRADFSNTDNGVSSNISICLQDKNGAYIELKEGEVLVNGESTEHKFNCYSRNNAVKQLTNYDYSVVLADSNSYEAKVTTPAFFESVNFPNKITKEESFDISWENNWTKGNTKVVFDYLDSTNNWVSVFENDVQGSKSLINISGIQYPNYEIKETRFTLSRTQTGNVNDSFNGGSVESTVTFERIIKIKK